MKKFIGLICATVLLLAGGAGYYSWDMFRAADPSRPIVFVPKTTDARISFWQVMNQGVMAAAKEYGAEVNIIGTAAETDIDEQIHLLEQVIPQKPKAIVLAATDYNRLVPISNKIKEAGIPLITVDSGVNGDMADSFVATDNYSAGRKAGQFMRDLLPAHAKVAVLSTVKGSISVMERERVSGTA
ncbi:substrate-binding domain-containing protein [Paenibacillus hexagrammi]|uniref:substrate-binding domain-containing protein n=1 Tax=Paenibacillus hexagrammi TaxID=2908839 RepID=UPI0021A69904|nr:substrate-binding domain-containing protein [Paenibacillus sp. YPD9-1]